MQRIEGFLRVVSAHHLGGAWAARELTSDDPPLLRPRVRGGPMMEAPARGERR